MRAIQIREDHRIEIVQRPMPEIKRDTDVLVRVTSAGICAADLEIAAGTHPFARAGIVMGHEFGGIVQQCGASVRGLAPGDKVTVDPVCACGTCHSCEIGKPNVCRRLETMGVHRDGGFAQYVVADAEQVYRYANQALDQTLLGLAEPYSIGAQNNARAQVTHQDFVLVLGAGTIGLCALQDAKRRGATVCVVDLINARLARATRMGADFTVNGGKCEARGILDVLTDGNGADVVINTACYKGSVEDSMEYAAYGGRIVIVGLDRQPSLIAQADVTGKELTILGSRLSTRLFGYVEQGISAGSYDPAMLCTHTFPFTQIERAFDLIKSHPAEVGRVVLTFEEEQPNEHTV